MTTKAGGRGVAGWDWLLGGLGVLPLRFTLSPRRTFRLPDWPGSMYRGALGHALANLERDAYDTTYRPRRRRGRVTDDIPPPYLIRWPQRGAAVVRRDEEHDFEVVLIGLAAEHAPEIAISARVAANDGLGTGKVPHLLVGVASRRELGRATPLDAVRDPFPEWPLRRVRLRAVTPLRLVKDPRASRRPTFQRLFQVAQRRMRSLVHFFGDELVPDRDESLNERAASIAMDVRATRWTTLSRASSSQGRRLAVDGLTGELELVGDLEPYRPLLRAMLQLHVGRYATIGHGRLQLVEAE